MAALDASVAQVRAGEGGCQTRCLAQFACCSPALPSLDRLTTSILGPWLRNSRWYSYLDRVTDIAAIM